MNNNKNKEILTVKSVNGKDSGNGVTESNYCPVLIDIYILKNTHVYMRKGGNGFMDIFKSPIYEEKKSFEEREMELAEELNDEISGLSFCL